MTQRQEIILLRASAEVWIGIFILPFLFFVLFLISIINMFNINPLIGDMGICFLVITYLVNYLIPLLRNWIKINPLMIEANLNGKNFQIFWREVLAAWIVKQGRSQFLCLGTARGTAVMPLRFFISDQVWGEVRERVPQAALDPDSMQRLPDFTKWSVQRDNLIHHSFPPLHIVDHWAMQVIGWAGTTFFLVASASAWVTGQVTLILVFSLLTLCAALLVMNWGITILDPSGVTRRTLSGTWRIEWDELERVEVDPLDVWMVLVGKNKRLALSGPALWVGPGREDGINLLRAQAEYRRLPLHRSVWAVFIFTKNARKKN